MEMEVKKGIGISVFKSKWESNKIGVFRLDIRKSFI